jgi:hypothetical protein
MIDLSDIQNFKANQISNTKIEKLRTEQAETRAKLADAERKVEQGENKIKLLTQSLSTMERKARTKRLIERGVIAESFIANAVELTNDEFKDALALAFRATN